MSLSIQDLCQEGVIGLMQAVDKFDPGKGYRFSTYGIYWIRNSILRAQTKSGHMLRSPHNVSTVSPIYTLGSYTSSLSYLQVHELCIVTLPLRVGW